MGNQAWQQANKTAKPMTSLHVFPALHFAVTSNDLFSVVGRCGRWFIHMLLLLLIHPLQADKKGLQLFVWAAIRGGAVRELPNHPIIQFNYSFFHGAVRMVLRCPCS